MDTGQTLANMKRDELEELVRQLDGVIELAIECLRECDDEGADELEVARKDIVDRYGFATETNLRPVWTND